LRVSDSLSNSCCLYIQIFSKNYFKGNLEETIYCIKDVHLWYKWNTISRTFKLIDYKLIKIESSYCGLEIQNDNVVKCRIVTTDNKSFLVNKKEAFKYFKDAFALGYPINCQFSLKPTLVFHFLPKFLAELCYEFKDYILGQESAARFINNNKPDSDSYNITLSYYNIFRLVANINFYMYS
jgi:hypothetical protein